MSNTRRRKVVGRRPRDFVRKRWVFFRKSTRLKKPNFFHVILRRCHTVHRGQRLKSDKNDTAVLISYVCMFLVFINGILVVEYISLPLFFLNLFILLFHMFSIFIIIIFWSVFIGVVKPMKNNDCTNYLIDKIVWHNPTRYIIKFILMFM